jgi:V/A-type H+-transporting ATPase subunit D
VAKLALNKSTLNREGRKVRAYKRFVPALDLKRKQLLAARVRARSERAEAAQTLQQLEQKVLRNLPMLADAELQVEQLLSVERIELEQVNLVGIRLPRIAVLELVPQPFSRLATPHWLDPLVQLLMRATRLRLELQVLDRRLELLEHGLQKTTQRLNLFDKVLIPRAEKNIRRIRIALADAERAGVVTSKIAKSKRLKAGMA